MTLLEAIQTLREIAGGATINQPRTMTLSEAVKTLRAYNALRRGDDDSDQPDPNPEIGKAIDIVISYCESATHAEKIND